MSQLHSNLYDYLVIALVVVISMLTACQTTDGNYKPRVLSPFMDASGRFGSHSGVDFVGNNTILAAADGIVYKTRKPNYNTGCGGQVIIWHYEFGRFTAYCHLSEVYVGEDRRIERGTPIGKMGATGSGDWQVHLHFEVNSIGKSHEDGIMPEGKILEDPMDHIVGCFDPNAKYPTDEFVLTHPVTCSEVTWD